MGISCKNVHATIGDYQRNYLYKVFIENVPAPILAKFPNALGFQSNVDIYNTKAVFPDRKTNKITIRWAGEFFNIPGTDNSTRDTNFEFFVDEDMWAYDFFSALKDLTGNEENQAGVYGVQAKFNIGVAMVSVDKETITAYRRLEGVRVYEIDVQEISKEGDNVNRLTVNIAWDRNVNVPNKRGKTI
ncbi:MAG: hypothetical protein IKS48_07390 [Eubacterium sp.]|nr:hypothetical protein [Methanobrevibacter sp.]MBR6403192.1 hypothetical protein [Eubacterium sp.]